MFQQVTPEEVVALTKSIEWAWNTRDIGKLCAFYREDATIIHPLGVFRGVEDICRLYRTHCHSALMGFMSLHPKSFQPGFTDYGFAVAEIQLECRVLDSDLRRVTKNMSKLHIIKQGEDDDILIVQDTQFGLEVEVT